MNVKDKKCVALGHSHTHTHISDDTACSNTVVSIVPKYTALCKTLMYTAVLEVVSFFLL